MSRRLFRIGYVLLTAVSTGMAAAAPVGVSPPSPAQVTNNAGTTVVGNSVGRDLNVTVTNQAWDIYRQAVVPANRDVLSGLRGSPSSTTNVDLLVGQLRRDPAFAGFLIQLLGANGELDVTNAVNNLQKQADDGSGMAAMFFAIVRLNGWWWGQQDTLEGRKYLELAADRGVPGAQGFLAERYWDATQGFPRDKAKANLFARRLADNEYAGKAARAAAWLAIGRRSIDGDGIAKDVCAGVQAISRAASLGSADAMYQMGSERSSNSRCLTVDEREALAWFERGAAAGSSASAIMAGHMHHFGVAGARDFLKAERYYLQASVPYADRQLGWLYAKGLGTAGGQPDYSKAIAYSRRAADAGDAEAMINVGLLYEYGLGVEQNLFEASRWYGKAADGGAHGGRVNQAVAIMNGCVGIEERPNWRSDLGALIEDEKIDPSTRGRAAYRLGYAHLEGLAGTPKDGNRARALFQRACSMGADEGCAEIVRLRQPGTASQAEVLGAKRANESGLKTGGDKCHRTVVERSGNPDLFP